MAIACRDRMEPPTPRSPLSVLASVAVSRGSSGFMDPNQPFREYV